ncbi:MAG: GNAT family N-acetyltransferase [Pseudomonadota bacterium]
MTNTTICLADFTVSRTGQALAIQGPLPHPRSLWGWNPDNGQLQFESAGALSLPDTVAAIGAALSDLKGGRAASLELQAPAAILDQLRAHGIALPGGEHAATVAADLFWQYPAGWLAEPLPALPLQYRISDGRRHPLRRPQPQGVVYRRHIGCLDQTLSFHVADIEADLVHFHRWMNDPHVAEFWQEQGDMEQQRAYLRKIAADPHALPLIACLDGKPFGYFEVYWAKEDRLAPFYDAQDYDRGWHVLIGEPSCRGAAFVSAWLPSISHYLFLDDSRTQRLVIEPRADNARMRRNLARSGYALVKEFDFPHKRALLGTLLRERFFAEQLWLPQNA